MFVSVYSCGRQRKIKKRFGSKINFCFLPKHVGNRTKAKIRQEVCTISKVVSFYVCYLLETNLYSQSINNFGAPNEFCCKVGTINIS